eukprot:TRINITY_DN3021_c1_g1_i1.p2 TRINITY_DN3021_c1_g1~~TRINITY_DN3021_c1_g1_i1.p2  ORF type:complete len:333 (-),score=64.62 TRINITY_DN3021_c1_g1_i1:292-1290(-)
MAAMVQKMWSSLNKIVVGEGRGVTRRRGKSSRSRRIAEGVGEGEVAEGAEGAEGADGPGTEREEAGEAAEAEGEGARQEATSEVGAMSRKVAKTIADAEAACEMLEAKMTADGRLDSAQKLSAESESAAELASELPPLLPSAAELAPQTLNLVTALPSADATAEIAKSITVQTDMREKPAVMIFAPSASVRSTNSLQPQVIWPGSPRVSVGKPSPIARSPSTPRQILTTSASYTRAMPSPSPRSLLVGNPPNRAQSPQAFSRVVANPASRQGTPSGQRNVEVPVTSFAPPTQVRTSSTGPVLMVRHAATAFSPQGTAASASPQHIARSNPYR